jgi:hypothetical protein
MYIGMISVRDRHAGSIVLRPSTTRPDGEDPRLMRFDNTIAAVILGAAQLAYVRRAPVVGWVCAHIPRGSSASFRAEPSSPREGPATARVRRLSIEQPDRSRLFDRRGRIVGTSSACREISLVTAAKAVPVKRGGKA